MEEFKAFVIQLGIDYNFFWFGTILIFSENEDTSLAHIFTMEKALSKIIFWYKKIICELIFKIFRTLFKTVRMQKGGIITFFHRCFRKVRF